MVGNIYSTESTEWVGSSGHYWKVTSHVHYIIEVNQKTISATDTDKNVTNQSIRVTVTPTAEKPRVNPAKPLRAISNLIEDQLDFKLNLSEYFLDDEDEPTRLKYSADSVDNLTVKIEEHTLYLLPAPDWHSRLEATPQKISIELSVEDTEQQKLTIPVNISVVPQPDEITFSDFSGVGPGSIHGGAALFQISSLHGKLPSKHHHT